MCVETRTITDLHGQTRTGIGRIGPIGGTVVVSECVGGEGVMGAELLL